MKFLLWYADSCMCTVQPHLLVYSLIAVATYRWGLVGGVGRYCCCQPAHPPNPHPPPPRGPQLHLGVDSTFCALLLGNILMLVPQLRASLCFDPCIVRQLYWIKILNISNWPMGWQRQLDIITGVNLLLADFPTRWHFALVGCLAIRWRYLHKSLSENDHHTLFNFWKSLIAFDSLNMMSRHILCDIKWSQSLDRIIWIPSSSCLLWPRGLLWPCGRMNAVFWLPQADTPDPGQHMCHGSHIIELSCLDRRGFDSPIPDFQRV